MTTLPFDATLHSPRLRLLAAHEDLATSVTDFYARNARHLAPWDPPSPPDFATVPAQRERLRKAVVDAAGGSGLRWWLQLGSQRWRVGLVNVGRDSMGMVQRTQRRASFKSSSNCCSRSGDAMNPNRV